MSSALQTAAALAIVAGAIAGLVWRSISKRRKGGCASGCGYSTDAFKESLKARDRRP